MDSLTGNRATNRTALVGEQDIATLQATRDILRQQQIEVIAASSGQQALDLFYKYLPDIIMLDDDLPGLNGLDVCNHIRHSTTAPNTPVMIITTNSDSSSIQSAYDNGATDFMQKPLNLSILAHRVNHMLQVNQTMQQNEDQLDYLNKYDPLTGLSNRDSFAGKLKQSLELTKKNHTKAAVLLIDIDNFKRINDTLGHNYGDKLLQNISKRLAMNLRASDLLIGDVYNSASLPLEMARLGGDEFTIFIDDIESVDVAIAIAKRGIEAISLPMSIDEQEVVVTPSVGIAIYPNDGQDVNTLLKNAEKAMYVAKEQGGCCYKLYDGEMNAAAQNRLKLESDLRHAIEGKQLELYYQPQIDTETGEVLCLEALCRWFHPELGLITPDIFIPIAEESGLIIKIGDWVLKTACDQAKIWLEQGRALKHIAVNVSAYQFHRSDFFNKIVETLNESNLSPHHLELELTESIIMSDAEENIQKLQLLKTIGVNLAVDDFGTGYSSLSYLKRFPINTLKIDRSFIANIETDNTDSAIVGAIIALADKLQLEVVAEGVETLPQLQFLEQNNCTLIQGFYFSKARCAKEVGALIGKCIRPSQKTLAIYPKVVGLALPEAQ